MLGQHVYIRLYNIQDLSSFIEESSHLTPGSWNSCRNMRISHFLGVAVLFTLALADHHENDHKHEEDDQHHPLNMSTPNPQIAHYSSTFSFDLNRQVALDHLCENNVFSPITISAELSFLSLGAKDQTYSQITKGLSFNTSEISEQEIHKGFHHLVLNDVNRKLQLNGGNALFISKDHNILKTFLDGAKKLYHSEVFSTDFKNTEEAKNQINSYVKNTQSKIVELLNSVGKNIILVFINYFDFRGEWEKSFEELTEDFYVNEKTTVTVPFMRRIGKFNVSFTDEAIVVSIPYKDGADAVFIVPQKGKLSKIDQNFNEQTIQKWKKSMDVTYVDVHLPKFKVSSTTTLKQTLSKLDVVDVFSDKADLSGITGEANAKISNATQTTVFSFDENGTEAISSTVTEIISTHPVIKFDIPDVDILIPKFQVSSTFELLKKLNWIELEHIFSDKTDLPGLTGDADIKISKAVRIAELSADEKGTEVTHSTVIEKMPMPSHQVIKISIPFRFIIYDSKFKCVLFAGNVYNPQE